MLKDWLRNLDISTSCWVLVIFVLILFSINILPINITANCILSLLSIFCIVQLIQH